MPLIHRFICCLVLCLAVACAGCSDPQKDAENEKKVETLLARLPQGWKADIDVRGDTLTIRNFSVRFPTKGAEAFFDLAFDELVAEKVDFNTAGLPDGPPPVGRITLKGLRDGIIAGGPGVDFSFSHSLALLEIREPKGDFAGLLAVCDGKAEPDTLLRTLNSWRTGPVRLEKEVLDFSYQYFGITSTLERLSLDSASLFSWKELKAKNLSVRALGSEVLAVDEYGYRLLEIPDFTAMANEAVRKGAFGDLETERENMDEWPSKAMAELLRTTPLRLDGLYCENLRYRLMTTDPVSLGRIDLNLLVSPDKTLLDIRGKDLNVPASVLALAGPPEKLGLRPGESLQGDWSLRLGSEAGGTGEFATDVRLTDRVRAACVFFLTFPPESPDFPAIPAALEKVLITAFSTSLEDLGGLDRLPLLSGENRETFLEGLVGQTPGTPFEADFQQAMRLLLEKGGAVDISVTCEPPVPFSQLEDFRKAPPAACKSVVRHTPAGERRP